MKILFLGKPGAGKGSVTKRLNGEFKYLSTGDLLREEVAKGTPEGIYINNLLKEGKFADDDTIFKIVEKFLIENDNKKIIFDGFPRNLVQMQECVKRGINFDLVFHIDVNDSIIEDRVVNRRVHPASGRVYNIKTLPPINEGIDDVTGEPLLQRNDDRPEILKERLAIYKKVTEPILGFLKDIGVSIVDIDGQSPISEQVGIVQEHIDGKIKKNHKRKI